MPSPTKTIRQIHFAGLLLTALLLTGCNTQQVRDDTTDVSEGSGFDLSTWRHEKALEALKELSADLEQAESTQVADALVPADLWERVRRGFRLEASDHERVTSNIAWYAKNQGYLDRVSERAEPYLHLIVEAIEARDLPMELALLPVVESAFQPFAYSHGRAAGLWQFIPGTGRRFGLKQGWWYDGRRDVVESTRAALEYLEYLHKHFDGDWLLALAAYNSGEGTVRNAIRRNKQQGKPTDFFSLALPKETRGYAPRLLAISAVVADPERYGVTLRPIDDKPYLAVTDVGSQIDLALAAELADISIEQLYRYNPAFNRWATDPDGPHKLLLPIDKIPLFEERLAEYPEKQRIQWARHQIKSGENLQTIAKRYRTTVAMLQKVNGLRGNMIRAGDSLIIPVAREDLATYRLSSEQRHQQNQARPRNGHRVDYVVRNGDTLWDISRRYRVGVRELASWNSMAPRDPLLPGRRLVIWVDSPPQEVATGFNPVHFSHPHEEAMRRRIGYTVRSGDSLARISQRFGVTIAQLRQWNNLPEGKYLQPGQRLTLYVDVAQAGNI